MFAQAIDQITMVRVFSLTILNKCHRLTMTSRVGQPAEIAEMLKMHKLCLHRSLMGAPLQELYLYGLTDGL